MTSTPVKSIEIYTDGACSGNPGPGGYGAILIYGQIRKELSGGFVRTTNNRMELMAAIMALEALRTSCEVNLTSDSKYLVDAIEKGWLQGWSRRGWKKSNGEPVKNSDLWERLENMIDRHHISVTWVKGHASNELNNRCDQLATAAAAAGNLQEDTGYVQND